MKNEILAKLNSYCWFNWLGGIIFIIFGSINRSVFLGVIGGINVGYALAATLMIIFMRKK